MTLATLGDLPILRGRIRMPLHESPWTADLHLDADEAPAKGTRQSIVFDAAGSPVFVGTVRESGPFEGRSRVLLVGGAGGLKATLPPDQYVAPTLALVVADIMRITGEQLSATSADLTTYALGTWTRAAEQGSRALTNVLAEVGLSWRVLRDGTVWVGTETWPMVSLERVVADDDGSAGHARVSPEEATLVPGVTLDGKRVVGVTYIIDPGGLDLEIDYGEKGVDADRTREAFKRAVRACIPELRYLRDYTARVVKQDADDTLEVICDDPAIGGLTKVPIRYTIPKMKVRVAAGARCLIGFRNASPAGRYAHSFEPGAGLVEVIIDGGMTQVSLVGDAVNAGTLTGLADLGTGVVTFTYVDAAGGAPVVSPTALLTGGAITGPGSTRLFTT